MLGEFMMYRTFFLMLLFIGITSVALAQDDTNTEYLVTFGPECPTAWGDDDFNLVAFMAVPVDAAPFYIWLKDPDCGGRMDEINEGWDTETKFALYGGEGAYTVDAITTNPSEGLTSGYLIQEETFGIDPARDEQWLVWGPFSPAQGEQIGDLAYFKLVVTGETGNDGNLYKIDMSQSETVRTPVEGQHFFTYEVSFRVPKTLIRVVQIDLDIEKAISKLELYNFDADRQAGLTLNTPDNQRLSIRTSANDAWESTVHTFPTPLQGDWSVNIEKPSEGNNDIVFYGKGDDELIKIGLPLSLVDAPKVPEPALPAPEVHTIKEGCNAMIFDASKSFDVNAGDNLTYEWDLGDGTTKTGIRVTHEYTTSGNYPVTLTVKDDSGTICAVSNRMVNINVNEPPVADAGKPVKDCPNTEIQFDGTRSFDPDGEITEYSWDFGDGTGGSGPRPTHAYDAPGQYRVRLVVTDNSGTECNKAEDVVDVVINARPNADAGPDQGVLGTTTVQFDGSGSNDPDADPHALGDPLIYTWDFGDGTPPVNGVRPVHNYAQPGEYTVKLKVQDRSGTFCDEDTDIMKVIINFPPVANAGDHKLACSGEAIQFDASQSSDVDGSVVKYIWNFGDGESAEGAQVSHTYAQPGIYEASLMVEDNAQTTNSRAVSGVTVTINAPPIAVAGRDLKGCVEETLQFDGSKSYDPDGEISTYQWDFGDGNTASGAKPTHAYRKAGTYTVKLTVTDNSGTTCATATDELTVTINQPPVAVAGDDIFTCNAAVEFNGEGSYDNDGRVIQYIWDFGDGAEGSGMKTTHVYSAEGTYTVKLTVRDDSGTKCDTATDELTVRINATPVANAVVGSDQKKTITCPDQSLQFDGSASTDSDGKITTYAWNFGDGSTAEGAKVNHAYTKPGNYLVTLTVTDDSGLTCNKAFDNVLVKVNARPEAEAGEDRRACVAEEIQFVGTGSSDPDGTITSYQWDFGDGSTGEGASPAHAYRAPGTYTVKLTVTDNTQTACNRHTDQMTVIINTPPQADAGDDITTCNTTVTFNGSRSSDPDGGALTYAWDFGDGTSGNGVRPTHTYATPGTYTVQLTVTDEMGTECSTDTDDITVFINQPPVASAGPDQSICLGDMAQFDGSNSTDPEGTSLTYTWDFGDGSTGEGAKPAHTYSQSGIYNVVLTVTDQSGTTCNIHKDRLVVTVYEAPVADAGEDVHGCINDMINFDGSGSSDGDGSVVSYQWDFGDGASAEGILAAHAYSQAGTYEVTLTITDNSEMACNTATDTRTVVINNPPQANAGEQHIVCPDETITFDGSASSDMDGSITEYIWDFGNGDTGNGKTPTHAYSLPGTYQASLMVKDDSGLECNSGTGAVTIIVNDPPLANAGSDRFACVNETITFDGTLSLDRDGKISHYQWDFGDGSTGEGAKPTHAYAAAGTYEVTLTVTDNSGTKCNQHVDKMKVVVKQPPVAEAGPEQIMACNGCAQDEVKFDASASYDPDGDGLTFQWDFGDGATGEGVRTVHTYTAPGEYTVTLTVMDDSGLKCNSNTDTIQVKVNQKPDPIIEVKPQSGP